jgi:hypothetical protein
MGFPCGPATDDVDASEDPIDLRTALAIAGFQELNKIKRTGDLDDDTAKKLVEIHGKT